MTSITRVNYRERQRLRADDLTTDQRYHVQARQRHNITQHVWGIVWGLALQYDDRNGLMVQPGIAIDGYGRELIVSEPLQIETDTLNKACLYYGDQPSLLDVWLIYREVGFSPSQKGRVVVSKDTRTQEQPCLQIRQGFEVISAEARRRPDLVDEADEDFQPWQPLPDDGRTWPVFLGQLSSTDQKTFKISFENRPYAELFGERVTSPNGQGWMGLLDGNSISRRFSVNLTDNSGMMTKRLEVGYHDNTAETQATLQGNVAVGGWLSVGGMPQPEPTASVPVDARGLHFGTPRLTPEKAAPWQFYRTLFKPKDAPPETQALDQLRIEMFNPGEEGDQKAYEFAIGTRVDAKPFIPCLTLSADCSVTLTGTLKIEGELLLSPIPADPTDQRFGDAMIGSWLHGLASSTASLDTLYNGDQGNPALAITLQGLPLSSQIQMPIQYTVTVRNVSSMLLRNLQVMEYVTYPGETAPREAKVGPTVAYINPNTSYDMTPSTINSQQAGQLLVAIIAAALTPEGKMIFSKATQSVTIQGLV